MKIILFLFNLQYKSIYIVLAVALATAPVLSAEAVASAVAELLNVVAVARASPMCVVAVLAVAVAVAELAICSATFPAASVKRVNRLLAPDAAFVVTVVVVCVVPLKRPLPLDGRGSETRDGIRCGLNP